MMFRNKNILTAAVILIVSISISAQSTEFTYQGSLNLSGTAASGNFDFEFALFTSLSGGAQMGSTLTRSNVAVSSGTFGVVLDFGPSFSGGDRFLEIRVRQTGGGAFTALTPRQKLTSVPYAVKSLNADTATNSANLNSQPASFYTNASNLSGGTLPVARLGNGAILNQTTQQAGSNFNISGNGTVGGTLSLGPGSVAAPSMTFAGDTDTGMFSVGADTLGFSTAGSQRIRITPAGNVGVGTSVPSARLSVNGIGSFFSPGAARFDLTNPATGSTSYGMHVTDSGEWQLATTTGATRMLVSPTGNVGIGNTSPEQRLDVSGNLRVSGAVLRSETGSANLVPIAYGYVRGNGTIEGGTGNFTATRVETGFYEIGISGENYFPGSHVTNITLNPGGSGTVALIATTSITGEQPNLRLAVFVHNTLSLRVDCGFFFVIYKP